MDGRDGVNLDGEYIRENMDDCYEIPIIILKTFSYAVVTTGYGCLLEDKIRIIPPWRQSLTAQSSKDPLVRYKKD